MIEIRKPGIRAAAAHIAFAALAWTTPLTADETTPAAQSVNVESPSKQLRIEVRSGDLPEREGAEQDGAEQDGAGREGVVTYSVYFNDTPLVRDSKVGLEFAETGALEQNLKISHVETSAHDEVYQLPVGKASEARNHYTQAVVTLQEQVGFRRQINLIVRAYDDGVAFRYAIPEQTAISDFVISDEHTHFSFVGDPQAYVLPLENFQTPYEVFYDDAPLSALRTNQLYGLPMLLRFADEIWAALTEANLTDYAGMYVSPVSDQPGTLASKLSPWPDEPAVKVRAKAPHNTPWRVLMIGDRPGRLIESNLITNLNEPCKIEDTSWIKPGKINFPWWNGYVVRGQEFVGGLNTATLKHYIDFCAEHGIEYSSFDGFQQAWYGGPIRPTGPVDVTTAIPEIDLPEVLNHAEQKGVRMRIWVHWKALAPQIDEAFAKYEEWGIEGVMIDFMDRDDQPMVDYYHEVVRKAALHHLTVNFHGAYKPTGIRRTWPNLLTREAVLNLEYNKWARCPPEHNLMVPFVRMLAGPLDYHHGGFRNVPVDQFKSQRIDPLVMGTRCHALAMYVVHENPLPMVADHPAAYENQDGMELLVDIPTTWDETRVLNASVGQFITIARRKGDTWYVGSMTDGTPRELTLSLQFLNDGNYVADVYADDPQQDYQKIDRQQRRVTKADSIPIRMSPAGGHIVRLSPAAQASATPHRR